MSDWKTKLKEAKEMVEMGLMTEAEFEDFRKNLLSSTGVNTKSSSTEITKIGSYRIFSLIGEGGMGAVYRAAHQNEMIAKRQGGDVAIKVMHAQYAKNPNLRARFESEATVCLKLEHPGIVRVYDLLEDQGQLGLVMEIVEGKPLSVIIGEEVGPIPWEKAQDLFFQLLDAVDYAHQNGVVHRDIKPENVMVTEDQKIKILDFGIAKDLSGGKTKTGTGMGTVSYMAPEQYTDAKAVDHRADIYALGMTLYEMLAGRLPWEGNGTEFEILTKKNSGILPPPTDFYPYIPEHVVVVIQQSIAKEIDMRPSRCEEFKQLLADSISYVSPPVDKEVSTAPPKNELLSLRSNVDTNLESIQVEQKPVDDAVGKSPPSVLKVSLIILFGGPVVVFFFCTVALAIMLAPILGREDDGLEISFPLGIVVSGLFFVHLWKLRTQQMSPHSNSVETAIQSSEILDEKETHSSNQKKLLLLFLLIVLFILILGL